MEIPIKSESKQILHAMANKFINIDHYSTLGTPGKYDTIISSIT